MLVKRPCPLVRASSSRSLIIPCDDADCSQVSEKTFTSAPSDPRKIVLGFNLSTEKKPPDVCESPRSVLDAPALPSQGKQVVRSYLGSLISGNSGSGEGVGLGIALDIQGKEGDAERLPWVVACTAGCLKLNEENHDNVHSFVPPSKSVQIGCVDADILSCQLRALEGHSNQKLKEDPSMLPWQSRGLSVHPNNEGFQDISTCQMWAQRIHDSADADVSVLRARVHHHHPSLDADEFKEASHHLSIFSASSPPSVHRTSSMSFLKVCSYCDNSLLLGKDIFMYRGDQAFCSAECRYQKIVMDQANGRQGVKPCHKSFGQHH